MPNGSIRVTHLRAPSEDTQGETIIVIDRSHPVLGNRHILHDKLNHAARAQVIDAYRADLDADFTRGGPMAQAVVEIAQRVLDGWELALACHCHPLPCHGDVIAERVRQLVRVREARRFHRDGTLPAAGEQLVFGSNLAGRHGKGAALLARERFGARYGIGRGPTGRSFAIPTKDARLASLPVEDIRAAVADFMTYARLHPAQQFFVTRVGCGLAGHADAAIAPLFAEAPANCSFPEAWWPYLGLPAAARPAYAGIGARKTPLPIQELMTRIAGRLSQRGFILRSGGAAGADTAFERGAGLHKEIFLPGRGFNGNPSSLFEPTPEAFALATTLHPVWAQLGDSARRLMARNCLQVLGLDLQTPAQFVVCWTQDGCEHEAERTRETGGTGQAIALADRNGIPVINLARDGGLERIRDLLEEKTETP